MLVVDELAYVGTVTDDVQVVLGQLFDVRRDVVRHRSLGALVHVRLLDAITPRDCDACSRIVLDVEVNEEVLGSLLNTFSLKLIEV